MQSNRKHGIMWAFAGAVCSAGFVVPWKLASQYGETHLNALVLLAAAALFNTLLSLRQGRSALRIGRFDLRMGVALGLFSLLGNLFSAAAIEQISPALLAVLMRSEVILVALMAWPLIGERVDRRFWLGALTAIAGLVLMQAPLRDSGNAGGGVVWALLAAGCFSAMSVLTRMGIHRMNLVAVNGLRLWLAVGMWFALNGFPDELMEINAARVGYSALAAFFGPFAARLCLMMSARHLEARITALASLGAPILTVPLAYAILADVPSSRELLGGCIMLAGIAIPILTWTRNTRPA